MLFVLKILNVHQLDSKLSDVWLEMGGFAIVCLPCEMFVL